MTMKKSTLFILLFWIAGYIYAQTDRYPDFAVSNFTVAVPSHDGTTGMLIDKAHLLCDSVMLYDVLGQIPEGASAAINYTGGTQNARNDHDNPYAVMSRVLKIYADTHSESDLQSIYCPDDAERIHAILSNESYAERFWRMAMNMTEMKLLVSFYSSLTTTDTLCLVVACTLRNGNVDVIPYNMVRISNRWYLSAGLDSSYLAYNLSAYLVNHTMTDALADDDYDGDGVPNYTDNCPCVANADQRDEDGDGVGDVCDNCPHTANADQADSDFDGVGDACDISPSYYNPGQEDADGDGVPDSLDNCPYTVNPRQYDRDNDGIGDDCDPDIDGDGIPNEEDDDMDGDGIPNFEDNCPYHYNPSQADSDGDGIGDACDNCPLHFNPNQYDSDSDGWGDECDSDSDGDGIPNEIDNCPYQYNPHQEDSDCDGIGDVCE